MNDNTFEFNGREYWAPLHGGYVRDITNARYTIEGFQVCEGLRRYGNTLSWNGKYPLKKLIMRESHK